MRIFIHVRHASARGLTRVLIRTVDTDVVALAIAYGKQVELQKLWIAFGVMEKVQNRNQGGHSCD